MDVYGDIKKALYGGTTEVYIPKGVRSSTLIKLK